MVTEEKISKFTCEICKKTYLTKESAESCESRPVSQDKGVKVGDTILITTGWSAGEKAIVTEVFIFDQSWGHVAWNRYWHTVGLSTATRQLTFDDYELVK